MPATTEKQRRTACAVLSVRKGTASKEKFPHLAGMMKDMSISELEEFCKGEVKKE